MPTRLRDCARILATILALSLAAPALAAENTTASDSPLTFERHIRPILKAQCLQCHGEEDEHEGELDLRLVRLMVKGGESGPAMAPGKPDESLLIERIEAGEMPPGKTKLTPDEVALLRRWISEGAKTARPEPADVAESLITAEDREFWSFRPVQRPRVPQVRHQKAVATPIDAFLLERLEQAGAKFAAPANRVSLLRRASFDLTGLPPTPEEVAEFASDRSAGAWERVIDRLLASPHYGERWGRHWLDVAGYADSDGYNEKDAERKYAYKYRDYVIAALNDDKPFDEFLREQLAGDELVSPPYEQLPHEAVEKLVATGFLRMGPDGTSDPAVNLPPARNDVMAETIKIVSTSILGLSVGCAQCHNHRYDPISQADYYGLRAIFEPAYDCTSWRTPPERLISLWSDEERRIAAEVDAEVAEIEKESAAYFKGRIAEVLAPLIAKLPDEVRDQVRVALDKPAKERTSQESKLLKNYPQLRLNQGELRRFDGDRYQKELDGFAARIAKARERRPAENYVQALTEVPGKVPATRLFVRGDINQPAEELAPRELTILGEQAPAKIPSDDVKVPTTGRRLAYARHLTSGRHPLTARVWVNRVWMHHFGRGIVATPSDFGIAGDRPSHPELLDWLADEFVQGGWRLKRLHKLILMSTAYQQSTARGPRLEMSDPDNRLLGRMNVRRLEAEVIRDAVLAVSGRLSTRMFGPPVPVAADEAGQVVVGVNKGGSSRVVKIISLGSEGNRRSVYVQSRRSMPLGMLETFDAPTMNPNCEARSASTVAPQSLLLMNNGFVVDQSNALAGRVIREVGRSAEKRVRRAWDLVLCHPASDVQVTEAVKFLDEQAEYFRASDGAPVKSKSGLAPEDQALATFCQALLSSNGFLYVD